MTTSFQLPVLRNIDLIEGTTTTIPIELGLNLSAFGLYGINAIIDGKLAGVSILSETAGSVSISVPSVYASADGSGWRLKLSASSSADPATQDRTLAWGLVRVVTPRTISPDSPIYHAVAMVTGDEFTFNVNLNANITGEALGALMYSFADGLSFADAASTPPSSMPLSVISPESGIVQVTVRESQSRACRGGGGSWWLRNFTTGAVLRAGPVTVYSEAAAAPSSPVGSSPAAAATPPNLGSVFL